MYEYAPEHTLHAELIATTGTTTRIYDDSEPRKNDNLTSRQ